MSFLDTLPNQAILVFSSPDFIKRTRISGPFEILAPAGGLLVPLIMFHPSLKKSGSGGVLEAEGGRTLNKREGAKKESQVSPMGQLKGPRSNKYEFQKLITL